MTATSISQLTGAGSCRAEPASVHESGQEIRECRDRCRSGQSVWPRTDAALTDLNRDGHLDLFEGAEARFDDREPPFTFLRQGDRFVEDGTLKFASRSPLFCTLTELANDAHIDMVCKVEGKMSPRRYSIHMRAGARLNLLPASAFEDIAAGDFDNNGWIDLFLARKSSPGRSPRAGRNNEVVADIWIDDANMDKPWGFSFRSTGKVGFRVASVYSGDLVSVERVFIGRQETHPSALNFSLHKTRRERRASHPINRVRRPGSTSDRRSPISGRSSSRRRGILWRQD
jgi:hypothetical protein